MVYEWEFMKNRENFRWFTATQTVSTSKSLYFVDNHAIIMWLIGDSHVTSPVLMFTRD